MGSCPVGHADDVNSRSELVEKYSKCPIGFEYDGVQPLGNCRRCGRAYSIHTKAYTECPNEWIVCADCLWEYGCAIHQIMELPEAKVGSIIWLT